MKRKNPKQIFESYKEIGPYIGLGTQLAASILIMFFLGRWLDQKFESEPALTIIFAFLGGFGGVYNFIRVVLNINEKNKREKNS
jgi:F0F1-type ATP synthase assembly protein I